MNLIIETDLGGDPDDFFTICYLASVPNVNIRAITISEGYPYQTAIASFLRDELKLDFYIGTAMKPQQKAKLYGNPGFHQKLLNRYGRPLEQHADWRGDCLIEEVLKEYPDCEFLAIGPMKSIGRFLSKNKNQINKMTVQGGFLGYHLHEYGNCQRLKKFENKVRYKTFNLGGDVVSALIVAESNRIKDLKFVSKNVCHTMVYDKDIHGLMKTYPVKTRADELFIEAMDMYLEKHVDKKFHDPTAAICHLHPEIAKWVRGNMTYANGEWGAFPSEDGNSLTIADIDRDAMWSHLFNRT